MISKPEDSLLSSTLMRSVCSVWNFCSLFRRDRREEGCEKILASCVRRKADEWFLEYLRETALTLAITFIPITWYQLKVIMK